MLPDMPAPLPEGPHRRLLPDVLAIGAPYPLLLAGAYAVRAHGLVGHGPAADAEAAHPGAAYADAAYADAAYADAAYADAAYADAAYPDAARPATTAPEAADPRLTGLEFVTDTPTPMPDLATALRTGLEERGWRVEPGPVDPLAARLTVTDPGSRESHTVDLRKETLWRPPADSAYGLVPAVEDVVGLEVRALADLGLARHLVDVRAASTRWSHTELEELGRRHARDGVLDLSDLQARLTAAEWLDDRALAAYGLDRAERAELRRWAQHWADDIAERLIEEAPFEEPPSDGNPSEPFEDE
ncbi:hypothetical protein [Streptomyces sp. ISL-11]|uniref:hypothetical protein n=1 Tax=Streptomyces sp. ISL-11 TaxID=2819174 RepID=UPI001BE90F70|nr:hypothetical protein [Streptomyces sp. ISL-11]MBT2384060.1 hypothetical protein [Streptomyces sp. ISL-11]